MVVICLDVCCCSCAGNPPGYGSQHLAQVGHLFVDVDMGGLVKSLGHRTAGGESNLEALECAELQGFTLLSLTWNVPD